MSAAVRIGVLGGTLDPIHLGHLEAALAAREALALDRVVFVPAHVPPHRAKPSTSPFHRFGMAAIAVKGMDGFCVSDTELATPGPSFTADTLLRLRERMGLTASQIFFITGADAFAEIETWSRYPDVLDMAHFVVVSRPGLGVAQLRRQMPGLKERMRLPRAAEAADGHRAAQTSIFLVDAPTPEVSSSEIRQRIAAGVSVAALVPPAVEHHIREHGLYREESPLHSRADHLHGQD